MKAKKDLKELTANVLKFERSGMYQTALDAFKGIWDDHRLIPEVDDLEREDAAEILLRAGSIYGFYGHNKQLSKSQEISKNLLTEAHNQYLALDLTEKVAECENYLALAYWRTGEFGEAETWVEIALGRDIDIASDARLYSYLIKSMVYDVTNRRQQVIELLGDVEKEFREFGSAFILGSFYTNLGLSLKNLGRTIEAIDKFEQARYFHQESGHLIYQGTVENNLAMAYKREGRFAEAHSAVDRAIAAYERLDDNARKGSSLDTKALVFIEEHKYKEAYSTINSAIEILSEGDNSAFLTEAYFTRSVTEVFSDDVAAATLSLLKAMEIARTNVGEKAAEKLAKDFEAIVRKRSVEGKEDARIIDRIYDGEIELILPPSLANYDDYQVIRIRNTHLTEIGIHKDSLAVVVEESIRRGDLIALTEIKSDAIICGFYDYFAGIVSISGINSETQLFATEAVKILGKIIGVGSSGNDKDNKIQIRPVEI
ncbi:MAG: tetratricopeptide repeat protein [Pyrinomonadaceae bacterium]